MIDRKYMLIHAHTIFSGRDSIMKLEDLAEWCKTNNSTTTITDHGNIGAWIKWYNLCKKNNIKPIFGCEFYINKNRDRLIELSKIKKDKTLEKVEKRELNYEFEDIKKINHILIVAKNEMGFHNIIDLNNKAYTEGFYMKPMVARKDLFNMPKEKGDRGLIVTTACLASETSQMILNENYEACKDYLIMMQDEFKEDFYIELQANDMIQQIKVNQKLLEFAKQLNIKKIIGTDSHYPNKKASSLHQLFLLMQGKQVISDVGKKVWRVTYENKKGEIMRRKFELDGEFAGNDVNLVEPNNKYGDYLVLKKELTDKVWMIEAEDLSIKTEEELKAHVAKSKHEEMKTIVQELIEENKNIYEKINYIDIDTKTKLPTKENAYEELKKATIQGLKDFKFNTNRAYIERAKYELSVIKEGGFSDYLLILKDMIDYAKGESIPIGVSRGSSSGSLICMLLGITRIDPIEWNLPFERFLDLSRINDIIEIELEDGTKKEFLGNHIVTTKNGKKRVDELTTEDDIITLDS